VKVIFKYEELGNFCFVCGIIGHTEHSCSKKHEPDYVEYEKKWGNFIRAENGYIGGGAASNKWLKGGSNTSTGGRNGAQGTTSTNPWINENWKHSIFGRVKVTCDQKTKEMNFSKERLLWGVLPMHLNLHGLL
jgi:hypothetical protein